MAYSKIPVNIITGFLGAGKTTAITQLLQSKNRNEKWAVIVNEFGKVSIDFELLSPHASANEKVFEISGGCICCSAKDYFFENLKEVIAQNHFDRIIVEPSGLGGAEMVSEQVKQLENLEFMPVICLTAVDWLNNERIQRNMIYQSQMQNAAILVISKCDTVNSEIRLNKILEVVKTKYPGKLNYHLSKNKSLPLSFLSSNFNSSKEISQELIYFQSHEISSENYTQEAVSFENTKMCNIENLILFFESTPQIIRAKGIVRTPTSWLAVHAVSNRVSVTKCVEIKENLLVLIIEKSEEDETFSYQKSIEQFFSIT